MSTGTREGRFGRTLTSPIGQYCIICDQPALAAAEPTTGYEIEHTKTCIRPGRLSLSWPYKTSVNTTANRPNTTQPKKGPNP